MILPALDLANPRQYLRDCRAKMAAAKESLPIDAAAQGITGATSATLLLTAIGLLVGLTPDSVPAGAQYAAQDARVQAYAQDQAKSYAKQQARDAAEPCASPVNSPPDLSRGLTLVAARLMGGMNVEDASYDDMDAQGDVAYNGGGGTTEI